ncbi:MAG: hypothetical protein ACE5EY_11415 [Anaerolineae bacterium]
MPSDQLTPLQQTLLDVVRKYPGRFSRSGLAKMLVGARSWQGREYPEFGRLAGYGRKQITGEIDSLLQQKFLAEDGRQKISVPSER